VQSRRRRCRRFAVFAAIAAACAVPRAAAAQWGLWPADSLLAEGRLAAAESTYYSVARRHPRDPLARAALGRFLAARGGTRAGAVLLEEARFFGGDSTALARTLATLYERLGDYRALDTLRPNVLSPAERRRVRWLAGRLPQASLRDSVIVLTYRALGDGRGVGTVLLRVGAARTELPAIIDPRISGLTLPSSLGADVRSFGTEGRETLAVADVVRIGGVQFTNLPVTLGGPDEPIRIGFDVIAPYFPGFDPRNGLLTLRRTTRRSLAKPGQRVPGLFDQNGLRLLIGTRWYPTTSQTAAALLASRPWMWDPKLGDVVLLGGN
jgi:hypothetical protein